MLHQRSRFIERSARTLAQRGRRHLCALADQLRNILPDDLPVVDKAARVKAASQDANWFSPPLRAELKEKSAECVVRPQCEEHVVAVARACVQLGVPLTPRGAGTGNYGQAVPLTGGVVIDLSGLDTFELLEPGTCRVGAGLNMADLEKMLRQENGDALQGAGGDTGGDSESQPGPGKGLGWELRMHPSTLKTATIGGFVAGGSGGVGSINYGVLRDPANVSALRIVTVEDEPRVLDLVGDECDPAIHAYGTNGIITRLDMPLTPTWPWHEIVVSFDGSFEDAAQFGLAVGEAVGIVKKQVAVFGAPIASRFFTRLTKPDAHGTGKEFGIDPDALRSTTHTALVVAAKTSIDAVESLAAEYGGKVQGVRNAAKAREAKGVPLYEYCWNHTTLHAIRKDSSITYLQTAFEAERCVELAVRAHHEVGTASGTSDAEVMSHLEFVNMGGRVGAFGIPLVQYNSAERLQELIDQFEAMGCPVFNPHTYVLEDGGMKETDWAQLRFKQEVDPHGLLNVGKMRAFDEQREIVADDERGIGYDRVRRGSTAAPASGGKTAAFIHDEAASARENSTVERWLWEELSTVEHAGIDKERTVAVLPIGAVEQHGPHLPVGVDAMHNEGILECAMQLLPSALKTAGISTKGDISPVLVLPAQRVGSSHEHLAFNGTLSFSSKLYLDILMELGEAVKRSGVRKLVLFNSHGGQCAHADIVARRLRVEHDMLVVCSHGFRSWPVQNSFSDREQRYGIHGGGIEMAVMQHLRPDLVQQDHADDFVSRAEQFNELEHVFPHSPAVSYGWMAHDLNEAGTVGDACDADPARGSEIVNTAAQNLSALLTELVSLDVDEVLNLGPSTHP